MAIVKIRNQIDDFFELFSFVSILKNVLKHFVCIETTTYML